MMTAELLSPNLEGRRVLITGGGTGVGADMALAFARRGAKVVITGRRLEPLQAVASEAVNQGLGSIEAHSCDVTDAAAMAELFQNIGACDIVIANAGAATSAPITKVSLEQWQSMLAVNLTGVFLTFQAGLNAMESAGLAWGRLITVASVAGLKGYGYVAPYCAAKHGVVGLVRAMAQELGRKPITVNALCPAYLNTEMTDRSVANIMEKTGMNQTDARARLAAMNPQKRLIEPEEVTAAALWLCSPGSDAINGQALAIAGGEV